MERSGEHWRNNGYPDYPGPAERLVYPHLEELKEKVRRSSDSSDEEEVAVHVNMSMLEGPMAKTRKLRDAVFLVIFVGFCLLMAAVAVYTLIYARYSRVVTKDMIDTAVKEVKGVIPKNMGLEQLNINVNVVNNENYFYDLMLQVQEFWGQILSMTFIAAGLSILMTVLLRTCTGFIVWAIISLIMIGGIGGSSTLWIMYFRPENKQKLMLAAASAASIITLLFLIIVCAMRVRIRLAVRLFKEAGKAVYAIPFVLLQPVWTFISLGIIAFVAVALAMGMETIYTYDKKCRLVVPEEVKYFRYLNIFAFIWMWQFIVGCQHVVIASSISRWFFTRDKSKLGAPLLMSFFHVVQFHIGSIALASLVITLVKVIRKLFYLIKKSLGKWSVGIKACSCCLWVLEKFLVFLTRNAYIEIAIYGYGFFPAAKRAFQMVSTNALRLVAVSVVGNLILFLAKLTVVSLTTLCGYYIVQESLKVGQEMKDMWILLATGSILSYVVSHCFISVYEMAVDTIFVCFCEDCKMNDGIRKPYFMSKGLMKFVKDSKTGQRV